MQTASLLDHNGAAPDRPDEARRTLAVTGLNHALHDGYTDLIYLMLPVWQSEFALSYALLAGLRALYAGAMAGLQVPAGRLAARVGGKTLLVLGTLLSACGYMLAGLSSGVIGLGLALVLSGIGSSTQHPIASAAVSRAYGRNARGPLGIYNFSGDLGKAAIPGLLSLLLLVMAWRHALWLLAFAGLAVAAVILAAMPAHRRDPARPIAGAKRETEAGAHTGGGGGFAVLLSIGILDTAVRMGLLTFLPFLLRTKGASLPLSGLALTLVFVGGAAGKFVCGWLGARAGTVRTVLLTEGGTAVGIVAVLLLPLTPAMVLLPLLGVMLNGTSSVLYGTVPELAPAHRAEHAFAVFYTGTIGSGAIAPVLYGILGDVLGPNAATVATALSALAILPLALVLSSHLAPAPRV